MKLKSWNINQRSGNSILPDIPDFVAEELLKDDPDVIVVTEFYKIEDWQKTFESKFEKYNTLVTDNPYNEVFLAVKKRYQISSVFSWESDYDKNLPDYIEVIVRNEDKRIAILGCRILVDSNKVKKYGTPVYDEELKCRQKQFITITNRIKGILEEDEDILIVGMGDFNTGSRNNVNKNWSRSVMESCLDKLHVRLYTPDGQSHLGYCCPDLLFASKDVVIEAGPYGWDFTKNDLFIYPQGEHTKNITVGYPDHGIISAKIVNKD